MPLRPLLRLRSIIRPRLCEFPSNPTPVPLPRRTTSSFHSTAPTCSASTQNHYETLQLTYNASPADIKRQFYTLSKIHHPDRNPDDPTASTRFVAISEAYHVLSVPEKRAQYDLQLQTSQPNSRSWGGTGDHPKGSYSSASFGSRPASGLNKKRSTFRGPPPSFYKTGGYGQQGAKRADYAHHNPHQGAHANQADQASYGEQGGFGPGQQNQGDQVLHFDDRRHKETHDNVNEHIARRRKVARDLRVEEDYDDGSILRNFFIVSGILGVIGITTMTLGNNHSMKRQIEKRNID